MKQNKVRSSRRDFSSSSIALEEGGGAAGRILIDHQAFEGRYTKSSTSRYG